MVRRRIVRATQVGVLLGTFTAGYLVGSVTQQRADAQLGDLGKAAMEKAGETGGPVGAAVDLGKSIVDMQQHVDGLQKNIDTLKKVKAALGG
jgi:hypothetical protein